MRRWRRGGRGGERERGGGGWYVDCVVAVNGAKTDEASILDRPYNGLTWQQLVAMATDVLSSVSLAPAQWLGACTSENYILSA